MRLLETKRRPVAILLLLGAAIGLFGTAGLASRRTPVLAERTTATALHDLTAHAWNGHQLEVSFQWEGRQVLAHDQPDCGHDYLTGDLITIYVAWRVQSVIATAAV